MTPGPGLVSPPAGTEELRQNVNNNNINCLSRSNTFSSGSEPRSGSRLSPRRRLPTIPPRAFSVNSRDKLSPEHSYDLCSDEASPYTDVRSLNYEETRRAASVGRDISLLNRERRARLNNNNFYSIDERRLAETDSGYPSYDHHSSYDAFIGEETSVDSPSSYSSSSSALLPKRNSSNFLWVDFKETGVGGVQRRPKNHDRNQKWSCFE